MEKMILTTESGSDVPQVMADELGIRIAPMHVILGDESYPDRTIPVADVFAFFKRTKKMPTTSAVNPEEYARLFSQAEGREPGSGDHSHRIFLQSFLYLSEREDRAGRTEGRPHSPDRLRDGVQRHRAAFVEVRPGDSGGAERRPRRWS